ncbi:hypothetical protein A0H81_04756 [Grifola frondosa]|uniref:Uncharacterized protein n=1 Tax=Grifola frondosa TaxID=5627 RepID=A0A1C7MLQ2_GRIFR|nr:hypothetical protein A0H81_04756 [Grifola frondosa]
MPETVFTDFDMALQWIGHENGTPCLDEPYDEKLKLALLGSGISEEILDKNWSPRLEPEL